MVAWKALSAGNSGHPATPSRSPGVTYVSVGAGAAVGTVVVGAMTGTVVVGATVVVVVGAVVVVVAGAVVVVVVRRTRSAERVLSAEAAAVSSLAETVVERLRLSGVQAAVTSSPTATPAIVVRWWRRLRSVRAVV